MPDDSDKGFRVVIAGGSIAGLSLALALERSGIDFVVLEAHPTIAPQVGASIAVLPSGARILDQLGCYDDVAALVNCSIDNFIVRDSDGAELIRVENLEEHLMQRHGYPMIFFERRMVIDVLYKHIRQKDKILTSRRVIDFEADEHGVSVKCQDGSVHRGSILVGADGIRSTVARQISRLKGSSKKGKRVSYFSCSCFGYFYTGAYPLCGALPASSELCSNLQGNWIGPILSVRNCAPAVSSLPE